MSWLDLVLSVPAVGIRLKPSLSAAVEFSRIVAPLVDELVAETGDANLNLSTPPGVSFITPDGLSHTVTFDNLLVEFAYPVNQKRPTGKMPTTETPKQRLYSELLQNTKQRLLRILKCFDRNHSFQVNRIGFIAAARIGREALPPGISFLMKHLELPWGTPLLKTNCHLLAKLSEGNGIQDQCHHILSAEPTAADHPDEVEIKLDWQRMMKPARACRPGELEQQIGECQNIAQDYFERVGEGAFKK